MEKVLIRENTILADGKISQAKDMAREINKEIIPALEELGIEVSIDVISDLLRNKGKKTCENFLLSIEDDVKRFKTKHQKDKIRESVEKDISELQLLIERTLNCLYSDIKKGLYLPIEKIFAFDKTTGIFLTKEGEDQLKESSKTYLTKPEEIKAYNDHLKAVDALNEFFKGRVPIWWERLFVHNNNGIFKPHEDADYSIIAGINNTSDY